MKEIKAYVRKVMRDNVIDALEQMDRLLSFAVVSVQEFGHEVGTGQLERFEMIKIEIDVPDDRVNEVVDCIVTHGRTGEGHAGDGRVVVLDIHEAVRIADGSREDAALE